MMDTLKSSERGMMVPRMLNSNDKSMLSASFDVLSSIGILGVTSAVAISSAACAL
jgi:hypothetical protein